MERWNTNLIAGGEHLGNVRILGGIFQGHSLSSLTVVRDDAHATVISAKRGKSRV